MYNLKGDNMKCHACKEEYSDEFDFCPFCGAYPKKFCPQCFKEVNDGEEISIIKSENEDSKENVFVLK